MELKNDLGKVFTILVDSNRKILVLGNRVFDFGCHPPPLNPIKGRYELRNFGFINDIKIRIAIVAQFNSAEFSVANCQMTDIEPFIRHHPDDLAIQTLEKGFASGYV